MKWIYTITLAAVFVMAGCSDDDNGDGGAGTDTGGHDMAGMDMGAGDMAMADSAESNNGVFNAQLTWDPSPPTTGAATLTLHLTDGEGANVTGASVVAEIEMRGMGHTGGGTPAVEELDGAMYRVTGLVFTMAGAWTLVLDVTAGDVEDRFEIDMGI